ncbi:hypothetical protein CQ018_17405 [Arthrobacter sp. MYb227]|uniref:hypothetical protein n=1 Tax=Arthrobacter sp. MYb227 TaxID=1848601 RepID=UPI000CFD9D3C|nr:hypothetical protein [Arthrobacter sp. MYb227]PQZ87722.1 hypothetical protein CQ018_17405 [Arthrobacter sp. MYb227]
MKRWQSADFAFRCGLAVLLFVGTMMLVESLTVRRIPFSAQVSFLVMLDSFGAGGGDQDVLFEVLVMVFIRS